MTAVGAEAVEFEAVGFDGEAVAGGHLFLKAFDVAVFELHDLSTVRADEVIVVAFMRDVVVLGLRAEVPRLRQAGFAKEIERAINRGQSQVRIFSSQLVVEIFCGDMFLFEKGVKNQLPLAGVLELMFSKVFFQGVHFFGVFRHGAGSVG